MESIRKTYSVDIVFAILRQMGSASATQITNDSRCNVSRAVVKHVLLNMRNHHVAEIIGQDGNSYIYKLTGLNPYITCHCCDDSVPRWNFRNGQCLVCNRSESRGKNPQLRAEFAQLNNPLFILINRVFRPLEQI